MSGSAWNVVVFGATGAIGSGVARAAAAQGARLWISARDGRRLSALAEELRGAGADVSARVVDATDEVAVAGWLADIAGQARLDLVFNAIGAPPAALRYPRRTLEASVEDVLLPTTLILGSQFLTAREAGRHMLRQGGGAIVLLSATLTGMTARNMAGITASFGAVEALTRALAGDLGPGGVRVNCVRASAMPETTTIQDTFAGQMALDGASPMVPPPLGRPISVADTAGAVLFLGGPGSSGMTGQVVTVCAGQFV